MSCKLGDEFFLFWRNLKNEAATAEKRYFDNVYYIHNKSCIFSPGAPKNQNYDKKFNAMLTKPGWIIWHHFWVDLGGIEISCTWVEMGRSSGQKYHMKITGQKAWHSKFLQTGSRTKLKISKLLQYINGRINI